MYNTNYNVRLFLREIQFILISIYNSLNAYIFRSNNFLLAAILLSYLIYK